MPLFLNTLEQCLGNDDSPWTAFVRLADIGAMGRLSRANAFAPEINTLESYPGVGNRSRSSVG